MATIDGVEVNLMPTDGMREEAQRYRDWKAEGEAGGTEVAARRASQILSGDELSPDTVIAMSAWFARHEVDKQGEGFSPGDDAYPSRGRVAWAAWGGDPGQTWSTNKADRIKKIRDRKMADDLEVRAEPGDLSTGDFVQWDSSGGMAKGRIDRIERDGTINVPDSEFTVNGDEDDPAALITVYRETDEGWEATDVQVGHRFSTLTKIEALRYAPQLYKRAGETSFEQQEDRTFEFSFSSEYPVERSFGLEVLSHESGAIDLGRLNDGAPLLFNHDMDRPIGVVERAYLDEDKKKGVSKVRFSRNAFAQEVLADVKDGIMRNISVGYRIKEMEERAGEFVATNWEPYEISVVSVPADPKIGVGRSLLADPTIDQGSADEAPPAARVAPLNNPVSEEQMSTAPDISVVREEASKKAASAERSRIRNIQELCSKHEMRELADQLIENGSSIDVAREAVLERIGAKPVETVAPVDLGQQVQERYSIMDGVRALLSNDWSSHGAGLVRELSQEVARSSGLTLTGERSFFVPFSALSQRATYVTSTASAGGNLVATDLLADDFIEALRNASPVIGLGVQTLTGLVGDVAIPRRSGVASTSYLSTETTAITQAESTFDQVTMSPKNLASLSKYSRQTLLQGTPGIEELIRRDLTDGINAAIDSAVLNGSGSSGQPTGIRNTSGIGSVAIGTNGGALTMDTFIDLETEVAQDNALINGAAYVVNAKTMSALKKLRAGGSSATDGPFLFNSDLQAIGRGPTPLTLNGYPIAVTNALPSDLTKGSGTGLSSAVMGDFSQALLGFYGNGLEITVGTDSDDFSKALTSVRGIVSFDVAVRHAQSFAYCEDIDHDA